MFVEILEASTGKDGALSLLLFSPLFFFFLLSYLFETCLYKLSGRGKSVSAFPVSAGENKIRDQDRPIPVGMAVPLWGAG